VTVRKSPTPQALPKARSGVRGLDEITGGGLPRGRPTLVCGSAGAGKTLFSVEFLVRGIEMGEPGVFMAFEETAAELAQNVASLGFDLEHLIATRKLVVDFVRVERAEIEETGEYDLEGLFVRLGHAIDSIGAKRVVLDTIESLFSGLSNTTLLRAELRRLFRWLKDRGVTAVITAERGSGGLTRQGLEEYVSDCVILLDHRVTGQVSTDQLGGPLRIAQVSQQAAAAGAQGAHGLGEVLLGSGVNLLGLAAVLSVGIGFMNLLPIPVLDGGHLLFYAYEALARRPLAAKVQAAGYRVGLALVLGLMLFATWNDLQQLSVFKNLGRLFS
jgi:KaiC/GvpD/RAD55 family RecA-like ATPase